MLFLIGIGHPQRQEPKDAASALKAREALPLSLEDREHRRMKRIGPLETGFHRAGVDIGELA